MKSSLFIFLVLFAPVFAMPELLFPTENTMILEARPNDFYMYVNRHFEGEDSKPWEAGSYGFVRNMKRTAEGVIGTRFHEGADIKPIRRDNSGEPLDPVVVVADGLVVYVQGASGGSNYGKYVVVEHDWGEGKILTLYAHLKKVSCELGQKMTAGEQVGILGYTGAGINKTRAHLHFEVALQLSERFEEWHQKYLGGKSPHGSYHGRNLIGMDAVALLREQKEKKVTSIKSFLKGQKPYFAVTIPYSQLTALEERYPWLWSDAQGRAPNAQVSFSASGVPLFVTPSNREVSEATITRLVPFIGRHEDRTLKRISGSGYTGKITESGKRYLALLLGDF